MGQPEPERRRKVVSPEATGGGPVRFQDNVAADAVARMIVGAPLPALGDVRIAAVQVQRRPLGAEIDDIVILGEDGRRIEISVKLGVRFTARDRDFREVIADAWRLFCSRESESVLYGLAVPSDVPNLRNLRRILDIAGESGSAEDFAHLTQGPNVTRQTVRNIIGAIRSIITTLDSSADEESIWRFLRDFAVLESDFDASNSESLARAADMLRTGLARPLTSVESKDLFLRIRDFVSSATTASGSLTRSSLIARLNREGVNVGLPVDIDKNRIAMDSCARTLISANQREIAGVHLFREAVNAIEESARAASFVLVRGPSGAGKSVALGDVYVALAKQGPLLYVDGVRLEASRDWVTFAAPFGLPVAIAEMVSVLSANSCGATIVLDAADKVSAPAAQQYLGDLLRAVAAVDGATVVCSIRERELPRVSEWLPIGLFSEKREVLVSLLSDAELAEIGRTSVRIQQLLAVSPAWTLLRNPRFLRLLDAQSELGDESPVSEASLCDRWWLRTVGVDGTASQTMLLGIANVSAAQPGMPFYAARPTDVFDRLLSNEIIKRIDDRDIFSFEHDIFEDWCIYRLLNQNPDALVSRLRELGEPLGVMRSVLLLGEALLDRGETKRYWDIIARLESSDLAARWAHALRLAPLRSASGDRLLEAVSEYLLGGDQLDLRKLIAALQTEEIEPNLALFPKELAPAAASVQILLSLDPLPRELVWRPFIRFLVQHWASLSPTSKELTTQAFERWVKHVRHDHESRNAIIELASTALSTLGPHEKGDYRDGLTSIILEGCDVLPAPAVAFLQHYRATGKNAFRKLLLHTSVLVKELPQEFADAIFRSVTEPDYRPVPPHYVPNSWLDDMDFGVEGHVMGTASPFQTPFANLLYANEQIGIDLVHRIARQALNSWSRVNLNRIRRHGISAASLVPLSLRVADVSFGLYGDEAVYVWFRPGAQAPSPLVSALAALEAWAFEEAKRGRPLADIFSRVLDDGGPVALAGICVCVGLSFWSEESVRLLLPFSTHPLLYSLDLGRAGFELQLLRYAQVMPMLPEDRPIAELTRNYEAGRHRTRFIRNLYPAYLFSEMKRDFQVALAAAHPEQTKVWDIDREDQSILKEMRMYGSRKRYKVTGSSIEFIAPKALQKKREATISQSNIIESAIGLDTTAHSMLRIEHEHREYAVLFAESFADVMPRVGEADMPRMARDFEVQLEVGALPGDAVEYARRAVPRCAAAIVASKSTVSEDDLAWARQTTEAFLDGLNKSRWQEQSSDADALDLRADMARAIGPALENGTAAEMVLLEAAFTIVSTGLHSVVSALFAGLQRLWIVRPHLCWNLIYVLRAANQERAPFDEETGRRIARDVRSEILLARRAEEEGTALPDLQTIESRAIRYAYARIFPTIPVAEIEGSPTIQRLQGVVIRSLKSLGEVDGVELEWRAALASLTARLLAYCTNSDVPTLLAPLDNESQPEIVKEAMHAFIIEVLADHFRNSFVSRWSRLCDLTLSFRPPKPWDYSLRNAFIEQVYLIGFAWRYNGDSLLNSEWPFAAEFATILDRWIERFGGEPEHAAAFIILVRRHGDRFPLPQITSWLSSIVERGEARAAFWAERNNRDGFGETVESLWRKHQNALVGDPSLLKAFSTITDRLVAAGVLGAVSVQRSLEAYGRSI